jgi:glycosyltransferase involved in cell wall biosynthesis
VSPLRLIVSAALALGCLAWLAMAAAVVRVLVVVPVLGRLRTPPPARWPSLSVVVPACDEQETLAAAARSRLASDYPDLELVLVDDRSRDGTPAIVDALAAEDSRVRALHVRELPDGWLGKVHAMEVGARAARGEWLLFTDADVHLSPGALRAAIALCEARGIDHLVALPQIWSSGALLDAVIASFGRLFLLGSRLWAVADPQSSASVGVGAFNLVRRSAWEAIGGFSRLRLAVADDVMLGDFLKRSGARQVAVNGRGQVMLHWYTSVGAMLAGLEKGLYGYGGKCRPRRLLVAGCVLLALDAAPFLAVALPLMSRAASAADAGAAQGAAAVGATAPLGPMVAGGAAAVAAWPLWLTWCGVAALLVGAAVAVVSARWMGARLVPLLLLPAASLLIFAMFLRAGWKGWRRGGVLWRGTFYPAAQLRAALDEMDAVPREDVAPDESRSPGH